jgi:hypothetical protein
MNSLSSGGRLDRHTLAKNMKLHSVHFRGNMIIDGQLLVRGQSLPLAQRDFFSYSEISDPPNLDGITDNAASIATNTLAIATKRDKDALISWTEIADPPDLDQIATNTTSIATNATAIASNTTAIATKRNSADLISFSEIADPPDLDQIATNTAAIAAGDFVSDQKRNVADLISWSEIADPPDLDQIATIATNTAQINTNTSAGLANSVAIATKRNSADLIPYSEIADPPDLDQITTNTTAIATKLTTTDLILTDSHSGGKHGTTIHLEGAAVNRGMTLQDDGSHHIRLVSGNQYGAWGGYPTFVCYAAHSELRMHGNGSNLLALRVDGEIETLTRFKGDGANITSLNASQLSSGTIPADRLATSGASLTTLNASQLTSGIIPAPRMATSGEYLTSLNATQLTSGIIPAPRMATSGEYLTSLNASALATGTVAEARLPHTFRKATDLITYSEIADPPDVDDSTGTEGSVSLITSGGVFALGAAMGAYIGAVDAKHDDLIPYSRISDPPDLTQMEENKVIIVTNSQNILTNINNIGINSVAIAGKAASSHTHAASDIVSGALHVDRIPNMNASKIDDGTFADARIPNLNASKTTAGTFHVDRIPTGLDAAKIATGNVSNAEFQWLSTARNETFEDTFAPIEADIDDLEDYTGVVRTTGFVGQKMSGYFADDMSLTGFQRDATLMGTMKHYKTVNIGDEGSNYTYKWWGTMTPTWTGQYEFATYSDDASFFWLGGTQRVNNGGTHGGQWRYSGWISLTAGTNYDIEMWFGEASGGAAMKLMWKADTGGPSGWTYDLTTQFHHVKASVDH